MSKKRNHEGQTTIYTMGESTRLETELEAAGDPIVEDKIPLVICGTCRYQLNSECHRHAPLPVIFGGKYRAGPDSRQVAWPVVCIDDCCGEHRFREEEIQ